jgi:hypothetical protein
MGQEDLLPHSSFLSFPASRKPCSSSFIRIFTFHFTCRAFLYFGPSAPHVSHSLQGPPLKDDQHRTNPLEKLTSRARGHDIERHGWPYRTMPLAGCPASR